MNSARDRLVVTWLADGGLRIGELCGFTWRTCTCGPGPRAGSAAPRRPRLRPARNSDGAEAKTKLPWRLEGGNVNWLG